MLDRSSATDKRERILKACRALILDGVPLPNVVRRRTGRETKSQKAEEPHVGWLPLSVSQNRLAAVVGGTRDSSIFGQKRAWRTNEAFEDDLRLTLVKASVHGDELPLDPLSLPSDMSANPVGDRQQLMTDFVRERTSLFVETISDSQIFLVGMSARSGVAATASERALARRGEPTELWRTIAERIRSSRRFYYDYYREVATVFGLEARSSADMDVALGLFTGIVASIADGLGPSAVYDGLHSRPTVTVDDEPWTYLAFAVGVLMNDLFTLDGADPIPTLRERRTIAMIESEFDGND
ncbi:MAG: hypothetical protein GY939_07430 [Actinomycetia bacterium]|nr:hypothetical protein [Actinomycetes bacterium]